MAKITPEFSRHTYRISIKQLRKVFGIKGNHIDDIRTSDVYDKDVKGNQIVVAGISITTTQYKKEIEEEEKIIPDGEPSARG